MYQIMINKYDLILLPEKLTKFPNFARKMPDYIIRQRDRGQAEAKTWRPRPNLRDRGQSFETEAKILATLASRT